MPRSLSRLPRRLTLPFDRFDHVSLPGAATARGEWSRAGLTLQFPRTRGAQAHWRANLPEIAGWPAVHLTVHGDIVRGTMPPTSVMARLRWNNAAGQPLSHEAQEYIPHSSLYGPPSQREPWPAGRGAFTLHDTRAVPKGARAAELILAVAHAPGVELRFRQITLRPALPPPPRIVHVGASCWWPFQATPRQPVRSPALNTADYIDQVAQAARQGVQLLVLPEAMTLVGVPGAKYHTVAEAPDGPTTRALAAAAKRHRIHVVACYNLRQSDRITNTATLFGPTGKILGRYDKVHLPNEEVDGGVSEGAAYPVFETEIGVIGMLICWDVVFPEAARAVALAGAEIVALPIWGGSEQLMAARALENHLYLVSSGFNARNTIIDPLGRFLANEKAAQGDRRTAKIVHAKIDLSRPQRWPWVGDFGHRLPLERRPFR